MDCRKNLLQVCEAEALKGFESIEKSRLGHELVSFDQALILNDSYKSNPQSALACVDTLEFEYSFIAWCSVICWSLEKPVIRFIIAGKDLKNYHLQEVLTIGI